MKKLHLALPIAMLAGGCGDSNEYTCKPDPGYLCTVAGNGDSGYDPDEEDGPALAAEMSLPQDTLTAPDGTIYLLDWNNHRLRSVTTDGKIHHIAGRGELGGTLDDPANDDFNHPTNMVFDPSGTQIVVAAWHNSKVRTVNLLGDRAIHDSCGDGRRAYFGDEGPAMTATLDLPASLQWSPGGELIIMDQANQVLRRVDKDGKIHRFAGQCVIDGPTPGPGRCATPTACPAPSGKFTCGVPATCGLPCTPAYSGDEGPAINMRISQPFGQSADPAGRMVYDGAGNLYFADTGNSLIRMIDTNGIVHRIAGQPPGDDRAPIEGYAGDGGPALEATLNHPVDLAIAEDGTLYFTDVFNHCVRAIDPGRTVRTVAGVCGTQGETRDGEKATRSYLKRPYGIELVGDTLIIADTGNNKIRRMRLP